MAGSEVLCCLHPISDGQTCGCGRGMFPFLLAIRVEWKDLADDGSRWTISLDSISQVVVGPGKGAEPLASPGTISFSAPTATEHH